MFLFSIFFVQAHIFSIYKITKEGYFMWHSCTIEETIRNLRTNIHRGLSKEEVISRMNKYRSK